jgi:DNA-directed RNA polymerase specialized sigma24 family protein
MSTPPKAERELRKLDNMSLLARAKTGDDPALEHLLARLHEIVRASLSYRYASVPGAQTFVEDATQEALFKIAMAIKNCRARTERQLRAWALTVSDHVAADMYWSPQFELAVRRFTIELELIAGRLRHEEEWFGDSNLNPADALLYRIAHEVYGEVGENTAALIYEHLCEAQTWTEIGGAHGTSGAAAKRRFQRAQRTMREGVLTRIAKLPDGERALVEARLDQLDIQWRNTKRRPRRRRTGTE